MHVHEEDQKRVCEEALYCAKETKGGRRLVISKLCSPCSWSCCLRADEKKGQEFDCNVGARGTDVASDLYHSPLLSVPENSRAVP